MPGWWTEVWSVGAGATRRSCGIAHTEDGFAVDVLRGDTCIASETYPTRDEAERAAAAFKRRFARAHTVTMSRHRSEGVELGV